MQNKYVGAYLEVDDEDRENVAFALKKRMKSELYNATKEKQYEVHGDGFTGGIVVVKITSMDTPDDLDEFKEAIEADVVTVKGTARRADNYLNQNR